MRNYGDFRQCVIPIPITCILQGTLCDTGIPYTFYGENICSVLLSVLRENFLFSMYLYHVQHGNPFLIYVSISVELFDFSSVFQLNFHIFLFFVSVELLEIQDQYARDVIQYLQVLDPGRTWRKSQILSKLRAITTALAKVSCIIIFMTYFLETLELINVCQRSSYVEFILDGNNFTAKQGNKIFFKSLKIHWKMNFYSPDDITKVTVSYLFFILSYVQ